MFFFIILLSLLSYFSSLRDQYTSPKIIRLKELEDEKLTIEEKQKRTAKDKKRLIEIEEEMAPLQKFLKDAQTHRLAIKSEVGMILISYFFLLLSLTFQIPCELILRKRLLS